MGTRRSQATAPATNMLIRGVPPATARSFRRIAERNGWTHGRALGRLVELQVALARGKTGDAGTFGDLVRDELFARLGFRP